MRLLFLGAILFLLGANAQLSAQNTVDPKSVDINNLSDQQILQLIKEVEKRGLTENEAIALAQAKGMTQQQISMLKQRMNELKLQGETIGADYQNETDAIIEQGISQKAEIDSAQADERIFGFSFFNNEKLTFDPNVNIPVSPSYVLGGGDEIVIDIWGASQHNYNLLVDKNGDIYIQGVGPIHVGGLTKEAASSIILKKLIQIYSDLASENPRTFASVNVGTVKAIKVNVIGEVFVPGTYTLPGTATAFNALYLSGGPNKNGSFRDIKVIRNGKVVANLDVYEYLIKGNTNVNISLRDADIILVPTYDKRVKVGGEFKREGLFEAKGEETVSDIITYAGGFNENAYKERIELYRVTDKERMIKDVLSSEFDSVVINNGDSIYAGAILERFKNKVVIEGAVYRPGNYELTKGLTLKQLIEKADGVREDVFLNRGLITRLKDDLTLENIPFNVSEVIKGEKDVNLKREDIITIASINDLRQPQTVKIYGAVQVPGEMDYQEDMTLSDLIFKARGFTEYASESYIEISRRLSYDEMKEMGQKIAHVYQFSVSRDLKLNGEDAKFKLEPFDEVFVRRAPGFRPRGVVTVQGEVKYAGQYSLISRKERISDIIKRTGGLSDNAYAEGAMLTRKSQLSQKQIRLREELMKKDTSLQFSDIGFDVVAINLKKILEHPGGKDDIFLKEGDEITIPREQQTVKISGEVLNPILATYVPGQKLKFYINQGGGFGLHAKRRKTYVIYPNGAAHATKKICMINKYPKVVPGSEIVVPQKPIREPMGATGWISIASAMASLALTIVTITNTAN
ncbi:MAG: sugar transporter [Chlorobi bacterium]|nr:sugar transporter [Chlorobiota bacterium]